MSTVIKPFINDLVNEIEIAFAIPLHLKGFTVFDPEKLPRSVSNLDEYGQESLELLLEFYGNNYSTPNNTFPAIVDIEAVNIQFKAFNFFVLKSRIDWEEKQSGDLVNAEQRLMSCQVRLQALKEIMSERKKKDLEKTIANVEEEVTVYKQIKITLFKSCYHHG